VVKQILIPVDGSSPSERALAFAVEEWPDAELFLLNVIDPVEGGYSPTVVTSNSEEWYERAREDAEEIFAAARETVDAEFETRTEVGRPAPTIIEVAGEEGIDHVVVGSHGRGGVSRILLGSVAEHVVRKSPVPVTVVRAEPDG